MKPLPCIILFLVCLSLFISSASAADDETTIHVQFQDIGLTTQQIVVFDEDGNDLIHSNTSSTILLDGNISRFYTIQLQPSKLNVKSETMLETILNFILANWIAIVLIVALLAVVFKR